MTDAVAMARRLEKTQGGTRDHSYNQLVMLEREAEEQFTAIMARQAVATRQAYAVITDMRGRRELAAVFDGFDRDRQNRYFSDLERILGTVASL